MAVTAGAVAGGVVTGVLLRHQTLARRAAERFVAAALETLLNAIDANDDDTGAHVRRVARYALTLAHAAELDEPTCRNVERVALFHDVGKIHEALFDLIRDPTVLSREERDAITTHPLRGARVLEPLSPFLPELAEGVLSHHERWDGTGYPRGLRGASIPVAARIVALADAFDAITHGRPYRAGQSAAYAARMIGAGRGSQFDPELVDLFLFPPVFDEIVRALRRSNGSREHTPERRSGVQRPHAADVTFRWRRGMPSLRPPDRRRRTGR
jgi:HD-GYP domain-containing protein (c-di-GMP phosphodiesterase class II)